jgi:hypothetical protein
MENNCYFVSSRGLLKSCNFHSNIPKSSCNNDNNYLIEMLNKMFDNMSIYVCSDLLSFFVNNILQKINKKFILVSGDSDLCVPIEALNNDQINRLINSQYLIKWYAQNTRLQNHNKIKQLPIGLDYHTILNDPQHKWKLPKEGHLPIEQEKVLIHIRENSKKFYERIPKIYANFTKDNDRFGDRKKSLEIIPKHLLQINTQFVPRTINWMNISKFTFVLSPFGIGMDCHRTWEALCLNSIPIIKAPNFKHLFEDLPVLVIDEWNEINERLLYNTIQKFKNINFNFDKLKLTYWLNKINLLDE